MPDYSQFINQSVVITSINGENPDGMFGATVLENLPEGLKIRVSINRQLTDIVFPYDRIRNIVLA